MVNQWATASHTGKCQVPPESIASMAMHFLFVCITTIRVIDTNMFTGSSTYIMHSPSR